MVREDGVRVGSDLMTWKKGFYANDSLNISPDVVQTHTNRCRHTCTDRNTHQSLRVRLAEGGI